MSFSFTNFSLFFVFRFTLFILFTFAFSVFTLNFGQVKIKEKVEIKPFSNKHKLIETNETQETITRNIQAVITFSPYQYSFPGGRIGYIWGKASIKQVISMFNQPVLQTSNNEQGGIIDINTDVSVPSSGAEITIVVYGSFGTTLGHNASSYNSGNANVNVQVYLDGDLLPNSIYKTSYSSYAITLKISKPKCGEGAPECIEETKVPLITLNDSYQEGDFGIYKCKYTAYFYPLISDKYKQYTYENYEVEVCFDQIQKKWKSKINNDYINVRAIRTFCNSILYSDGNTIIENIEDISIKISPENACEAMRYFFYHRDYPSGAKFAIKEFIEEHEKAHADSFRTYIKMAQGADYYYNSNTFNSYSDLIKSFDGDCAKFFSYNQALQEANKMYSIANENLRKNLIKIFKKHYSIEDEKSINLNLITIIIKYQDALIKQYPEIKNNLECYAYYLGE